MSQNKKTESNNSQAALCNIDSVVLSSNIVKKFADSETKYEGSYPAKEQNYTHWLEYTDGRREFVNAGVISGLWNEWIISEDCDKDSEIVDGVKYNVFIFKSR